MSKEDQDFKISREVDCETICGTFSLQLSTKDIQFILKALKKYPHEYTKKLRKDLKQWVENTNEG